MKYSCRQDGLDSPALSLYGRDADDDWCAIVITFGSCRSRGIVFFAKSTGASYYSHLAPLFSLLPFIRGALNSRDVITTSFQDDCCVEDRNQVVSFYSRIRPDGLDSTQISVGCETLSLFTCALRHSLKARTWTRTPSECIHQERRPGKEE